MADDDWDDGPSSAPAPSNNIGFGAGRGFKPAESDGSEGRKPGGGGFGGESRGFGGGGGGSRGFGGGDNQDGESRRGGGGGGYRGGRGGGGGGFSNRNNDGNESRGFGGGGGRGFGGGNNDGEGGGGGGGYRGGRGGGGNRGFGGGDREDGGSRGFGGDGGGGGGGGFRGGRGGGGGFNRRNDDDGESGGGGGGRGFGRRNDDGEGGGGGGRGFGGGGGGGGFNRRNDDGEGGGGGGRGFGGGGGRGGFNRRNDDDGEGGGGGRGFGGGGGRGGFNRRNDDGEGGGGGGRGFGGGGGGGGFGRRNDEEGGGGGGRGFGGGGGGGGFGRRNDDGEGGGGRGFGGGRGGGDGGDGDKPPERYVPRERTEEEMYSDGTKAGINFSKYDSIEVKTSGENVPPAIQSFEEANLRSLLLQNIKKCGYTVPTPVQKYSLPIIMAERDMMASAQTGSGKTAAFIIPIIHRLLEKPREIEDMADQNCVEPRAIVIAPTRELAIQTHEVAVKFCKDSRLNARIAYGGASLGHQLGQMFKGCDILIGTPGRLKGILGMGKIAFNSIEFVVLDEADRMLDMGFLPDVEAMLQHDSMPKPGERHTLMFSATFPTAIQQLAGKYMHDYVFVAVGIVGGACTDISQNFVEVGKRQKKDKLKEILEEEKSNNMLKGILVFVETKRSADFTAAFLSEKGYPTTSIHGDRMQREREEALWDFKSGKMGILVATAVAARGLDIPHARFVINMDLPETIDEYIHRIGRTGRVGNEGKAISFYDPDVDARVKNDLIRILSQAGQPVPEWLESGGSGGNFGPAANFGGQDIRSFSDVQDASRGAAQPVEEEEEW